jgi:hypothetical protein
MPVGQNTNPILQRASVAVKLHPSLQFTTVMACVKNCVNSVFP